MFSPEAIRLADPPAATSALASADRLVEAVEPMGERSSVTRLLFADSHRDRVLVYFRDRGHIARAAIVDADTARLRGSYALNPSLPAGSSVKRWIYLVHIGLRGGDSGMILVGFSGLFLLVTAAAGLWVGWPRQGTWRASFTARRWRGDMKLYGWHRAIGLAAGFAVLLMAITGASMEFKPWLRTAAAGLLPFRSFYDPVSARQGSKGPPATRPRIGAQQAIDIAVRRFPGALWTRVFPPAANARFYAIQLRQPRELGSWLGSTAVQIDSENGAILDAYDPLHAPIANRAIDLLLPVHDGELLGLPARILIMLVGLSLPTLYVLGVLRWWRRRRRRAFRYGLS